MNLSSVPHRRSIGIALMSTLIAALQAKMTAAEKVAAMQAGFEVFGTCAAGG
jgi:hypothetical protein